MASSQLRPAFDEDDPKYRCVCCTRFHAKKGTKIISVLGIIGAVLAICGTAFQISGVLTEIFIVLGLVSLILLAISVMKEKKQLTLPYMIYSLVGIGFSILMIIFAIIVIIAPESFFGDWMNSYQKTATDALGKRGIVIDNQKTPAEQASSSAWTLLLQSPFSILFSVWFLHTVYTYYTYLKDKEESRKHIPM